MLLLENAALILCGLHTFKLLPIAFLLTSPHNSIWKVFVDYQDASGKEEMTIVWIFFFFFGNMSGFVTLPKNSVLIRKH